MKAMELCCDPDLEKMHFARVTCPHCRQISMASVRVRPWPVSGEIDVLRTLAVLVVMSTQNISIYLPGDVVSTENLIVCSCKSC